MYAFVIALVATVSLVLVLAAPANTSGEEAPPTMDPLTEQARVRR